MEIERKFLMKEVTIALEDMAYKELEQAYISFFPTIRIRKSADAFFLTVKGKGHLAREEFEMQIEEEAYLRLLEKTEGAVVKKRRYFVPLTDGHTAELDVYHGDLEGLFTVEVEFSSIAEAEAFVPPTWFGEDVTEDKRYKNTSLAQFGLPK